MNKGPFSHLFAPLAGTGIADDWLVDTEVAGAARMGSPFEFQTTNLVGPVLATFENGSPVLVDQPPFRFTDIPLATATGNAPQNLDSILKSVAADLGWHTTPSPGGFTEFVHDAAALVTSQSQPGSPHSGGSGTSSPTGSALVSNTVSPGLTINVVYDSSVANAPAGFVAGVNAAVQYLESQFHDPITITIAVGYGEVGGSALGSGALGESETYLSSYTYAQLTNAMKADATSPADASAIASLLATNPTGNGTFWVSTAEAKALGLAPSDTSIDGYIGFTSSSNTFDYNNADGVTAGQYDFYGVVLHEITEVMGRQTMNGQSFAGTTAYEPLDLFRYSAPGVHTFSGTKAGYFSADGGTTHLANFNTNAGGDFGDWTSTPLDAMNAFGSPGMIEPMTSADITAMDVLGYNVGTGSPPPQPSALADLTTSGLSLSFGGPNVSFHLNNTGTGAAAASSTGLYLSTDSKITATDTLLGTVSSPSLNAAASDSESIALSLPTNLRAGTYFLGVLADSSGQVSESNETNNASNAIPIVVGSSSGNTLTGTSGSDVMFGLAGNDSLKGGAGNDVLIGGTGSDTLTGGTGNDQFVFNKIAEGLDQITDFSLGDLVDFSASAFGHGLAVGGTETGVLDPSHFVANTTGPTTASQEFWFNTSNHTLYFDSNGSAAGGQTAIAHLQTNFTLHSTDILLV